MHWIVILLWLNLLSFGVAFGAGLLLLQLTARPWRRCATSVHWSERARLAYGPGIAILWLALGLSGSAGLIGQGALESLNEDVPGFVTNFAAAFAGAITVRYIWLRELWGARVTFRSWLAGCLVVLFALVPFAITTAVLIILLPAEFGLRATCIFLAAVVAVILFARGAGILILRALGIVKPAAPALASMVDQLAQQMNVPGPIKVFVLEWAQVNAVAWQVYRAIGFSRALIEVMDEHEVRAVAAHELAHLLEPAWVRRIRIAYMFAYLPIVPLMRYGGLWAIPVGGILFFGVTLAYIRFTHRFEKRADQVESDAIADPGAYMRSLTKLHQANSVPAVMPGKQTHPHLYDRLLAGGIQPDFVRPLPPSRTRPLFAVVAATIVVTILMFSAVIVSAAVCRSAGVKILGVKAKPAAQNERSRSVK